MAAAATDLDLLAFGETGPLEVYSRMFPVMLPATLVLIVSPRMIEAPPSELMRWSGIYILCIGVSASSGENGKAAGNDDSFSFLALSRAALRCDS